MSITASIFRKDYHQFRILAGLVAVLLAVLVAVRLEWTGNVTPDPSANSWAPPLLESMLFLITMVLAGKLAAFVVFDDSPSRNERFLATRPVAFGPLVLAKLSFLAAFIVVPFAITAALYLALSGMPAAVTLLGTAQSLVRTLVLLGVTVPLVLLWETPRRLVAGIAAAGLGLFGAILTLGLLQEHRSPFLPFRPDTFADPLAQVVCVAIAAVLVTALVVTHFRRPLGMFLRLVALLFSGVAAPLLGGLLCSGHAPTVSTNISSCGMVRASLNPHQSNHVPTVSISLSPDRWLPVDQDVNWSFSSLSFGTHQIPQYPQSDPFLFPAHYLHQGDLTRGIEAAIHRHLGPGWSLETSRHGRAMSPNPAHTFTSESDLPTGPARIGAVFQGRGFSWHTVADLSLDPGNEARDGNDTWTYHGYARQREESLAFSITHRGPELWLNPRERSPLFENDVHYFALLDPERQLILPLEGSHPVRQNLAVGTACPRRGLIVRLEGSRSLPAIKPEKFRLLILRPRYEGARFCNWESPKLVALRSTLPTGASGLARTPCDLKSADIALWLDAHPAPRVDAPSVEVARYLVSLLEQTNRTSRLKPAHPAVATLSGYAPGHLLLFLRALSALQMDHHTSKTLLIDALEAGLEHRQLPEIVRYLPRRPSLAALIFRRGWAADAAPDLARLIRNGNHDRLLLEAAASLSDTAGITREEWLAIFRLEPTPSIYRILLGIPGLETSMNAVIDTRLTGRLPVLMDTSIDPLLDLALVRGHASAPALLHDAVLHAVELDEFNRAWFSNTIRKHVDLSSFPDNHGDPDRIVPWFLAKDPAIFTFDPSTRLYTIEKPQG